MLDKLRSTDFAPHLHETFQLSLAAWGQAYDPAVHGPLRTLELIEVKDIGVESAAESSRQPFSLIFCEASGTYLPQQTFSIEHPALGQFDLFLVPIGPDQRGMRYQAVIT